MEARQLFSKGDIISRIEQNKTAHWKMATYNQLIYNY